MKFILTKPYFNSQKNCKKKNKNYLIDNVKLDGVKDKLKEAKSNKMRYLIHLKHFTVEIHCYLSHSMVKHNYRLKCSSILRDVDVNPSKFFIILGGITKQKRHLFLPWLITFHLIYQLMKSNIFYVFNNINYSRFVQIR